MRISLSGIFSLLKDGTLQRLAKRPALESAGQEIVGQAALRQQPRAPRPNQNRLLIPADKKTRGGVLPATREPALKSSWTSLPIT